MHFKETHGHLHVPAEYPLDPSLGMWVRNQRFLNRRGLLDLERYQKLDALGFEWAKNIRTVRYWEEPVELVTKWQEEAQTMADDTMTERSRRNWDSNFQKLWRYKDIHGDVVVPSKYAIDPTLGRWVSKQRFMYNRKRLSKERYQKLDAIGFEWVTTEKRKRVRIRIRQTIAKQKNLESIRMMEQIGAGEQPLFDGIDRLISNQSSSLLENKFTQQTPRTRRMTPIVQEGLFKYKG